MNILSRIDDALLLGVKERSDYIFKELKDAKGIEDVSGLGLMIGFKPTALAKEIVNKCIQNGVIALTAKEKVRLLPALNIPFELLKRSIEIIKKVCERQ